jgi:hypothetical protein
LALVATVLIVLAFLLVVLRARPLRHRISVPRPGPPEAARRRPPVDSGPSVGGRLPAGRRQPAEARFATERWTLLKDPALVGAGTDAGDSAAETAAAETPAAETAAAETPAAETAAETSAGETGAGDAGVAEGVAGVEHAAGNGRAVPLRGGSPVELRVWAEDGRSAGSGRSVESGRSAESGRSVVGDFPDDRRVERWPLLDDPALVKDRAQVHDRARSENGTPVEDSDLRVQRALIGDRALIADRALIRARPLAREHPRAAYFLGVAGGAALALTLGGVLFLALPGYTTALVVLILGVVTWMTVVLLSSWIQLRR